MQNRNPKSDDHQHAGDNLNLISDLDQFSIRPYGCGTCDEMFETENQCMEHCNAHYPDHLQKDTFLQLSEIHPNTYFP